MTWKEMILYYSTVCFILGICYSFLGEAKVDHTIKIAIIDSGYDAEYAAYLHQTPLKLCSSGHYDFATATAGVGHTLAHGTVVAGIIAKELKDIDYCAVIYQVGKGENERTFGSEYVVAALNRALYQGLLAINMSFSGAGYSAREYRAIKELADKGTILFVAAGNDNIYLDRKSACTAFPACYDISNLEVVGALKSKSNKKCLASNYGPAISLKYSGDIGVSEGGDTCATSFATPRAVSAFVQSFSDVLHRKGLKQTSTKTQ